MVPFRGEGMIETLIRIFCMTPTDLSDTASFQNLWIVIFNKKLTE